MEPKRNDERTRILVLGATGRTGKAVVANLERFSDRVQVVSASRNREQVEHWKREGKEAVYLDLDFPETFTTALLGIHSLFLATGYTVAMVHQSKTIVDAAADAGVQFIVHLGIFGNGRMTDPHFAWHEMVERYIEGSGVAWAHLHPHFFMDNLLTTAPIVDGKLFWFAGEQPVGWIAPEDLAAVAAQVLAEGPKLHAGKQYWLSTEVLNGTQAATEIAAGLGQPVQGVVLAPEDLVAQVSAGVVQFSPSIEANYAASMFEWVRQTYQGLLNFGGVTTTVEDLTGQKPLTLRQWVGNNRDAVLAAGRATADRVNAA